MFLHTFSFCYQKCRLKEEPLTFGALCVLKHLLPRSFSFFCLVILILFISYLTWLVLPWRSSEAWHNKRPLLVDTVKTLLDEHNLAIRKALSEVWCYIASKLTFHNSINQIYVFNLTGFSSCYFHGSWLWWWLHIVTWLGHPQSCLSNILYAIVLYQNMIKLFLKAPR